MSRFYKLLTVLLSLALLSAALAPLAAAESAQAGEKNGHFFYDPPIQVNIARSVGPDVRFKPGEDINNNQVNDWLLEEFGLDVNYIWTTPTTDNAFYTKLMLSIAAGDTLPEFFAIPGTQAHELIESGLFMPIDDLLDAYAGEIWQNSLAEVPNVSLPYVRDGELYAYPLLEYLYEHEDVVWIRQDWLDLLGLEAPTTLEELREVMDAFSKLDASVTGQSKVYGMTAAMQSNYTSWIGENPIWGGFGAIPQIWMQMEDGSLVYGSTLPPILDALKEFKDWIDKGYFPPDVVLFNEVQAYEVFTAGKAGMAIAPTWSYDWPLRDVEKNVEGAVVRPYPIPMGPTGSFIQVGQSDPYQVMLFAKSAKNPQVFFELSNYLYENFADPAFGSQFEYGWREGYDYAFLEDGTPTFDTNLIPDGKATLFFFMSPLIPSMKMANAAFLAEGNEPQSPAQVKSSLAWNENFLKAAQIAVSQREHTVPNMFNGAPTPSIVEMMPDLRSREVELFSSILYGKVDPEAGFEQWLAFWEANGGPQITEEVNEWYRNAKGE